MGTFRDGSGNGSGIEKIWDPDLNPVFFESLDPDPDPHLVSNFSGSQVGFSTRIPHPVLGTKVCRVYPKSYLKKENGNLFFFIKNYHRCEIFMRGSGCKCYSVLASLS